MSRKNSAILIVILLLTICPPLFAQSQLAIAKEFKVLSVNGKDHLPQSSLKTSLLKLNGGRNKIAISYGSIFENERGYFERIESKAFIISFYLPSDGQYRLLHLKQANLIAAKKFAQNPLVNIVNQQGESVKYRQFFPSSQSIDIIHQSTQKRLEMHQPIRLISKKSLNKKQEPNISKEDAEAMLLFWWQQASPLQRQSFLNKIKFSN